ncbi:hypothetical protein DPMN_145247 [Dreissena polymorpha]|uniref:Uncharacterized protein n=1 Tax=Dreissena polymorpha TaxID=45954 RepID=A0A9D4F4R2_DREPO|nr:hypothetical protein DPMN_145247 [Dreissena polymorpha]
MCAWNNHYCWPGTCGSYGLTKDCKCDHGFLKRLIEDDSDINAGETTCQPNTNPDISTCDMKAIGLSGETKSATSLNLPAACQNIQDVYGNYQPVRMDFVMVSDFIVSYNSTRPSFIREEHFGITDMTVNVKIKTVQGFYLHKSSHIQLRDAYPNSSVTPSRYDSGNISVNDATYKLQNGEALCLEFEAKAGGYLKNIDTRSSTSGIVPYTKVVKQRTVCYRYDNAPPEHCTHRGRRCLQEPLEIPNRISRIGLTKLYFGGWTDPVLSRGLTNTASSIESFEIIVNEVTTSKGILKVDYAKDIFSARVNVSTNHFQLNLTADSPRLYCITLEVKDVADNVRQTRRFILYDNTSFIEAQNERSFRFDSASQATNFTWQTNHNSICLSWKEYFVNKFYLKNKLLNSIEPHPSVPITGGYEQITGPLPVSGTPNVHGIIQYNISWKVRNGDFGPEHIVPNFQSQNFCIGLNVSDGQAYVFNVRPIDIVNNTFNESRIVYIDRTPPYVSNVTLTLDNYKINYLKSVMDAAKLVVKLNAFDPHSGLQEVRWVLETEKTSSLHDSVSIRYTGSADIVPCLQSSDVCYCPAIGGCESVNVSLPLTSLAASGIHIGQFTGNYSLTIQAINKALLATSETLTISVDTTILKEGYMNTNDSMTGSPTITIAIASSLCGLAVLGAIAITVVIFIRRKRAREESDDRDSEQRGVMSQSFGQHEGDEHVYEKCDTNGASNPVSYEMDQTTPHAEMSYPTTNTSNRTRRNADTDNTGEQYILGRVVTKPAYNQMGPLYFLSLSPARQAY